MIDKVYLYCSMTCGVLKYQLENWENKINYQLRFIIFWALSIYAASIAVSISRLPEGSIDLMLNNLFHPIVIFCSAILIAFSMLGTYCLVLAGKVKATL